MSLKHISYQHFFFLKRRLPAIVTSVEARRFPISYFTKEKKKKCRDITKIYKLVLDEQLKLGI
jgi:hypothetical protein